MEVLSKVISMILVVILMTLFPLQYLLGHQLALFDEYVEAETIQLVEDIKEKEYLDVAMYEAFQEKLNVTGLLYDIEIEHAVPKEGADTTSVENIPGISVVSSELRSLPSTAETEGGVTYEDRNIRSLALHTHTDACYAGHRHDATCYRVGAPTQVYVQYRDSYWRASDYDYSLIQEFAFSVYSANSNKLIAYIAFEFSDDTNYPYIALQTQWADYDALGNVVMKTHFSSTKASYGAYTATRSQFTQEIVKLRNYIKSIPSASWDWTSYNTVNFDWAYKGYPAMTAYDWQNGGTFIDIPYIGSVYDGVYGQNWSCGQGQDENPRCNQVVTSITATNPTQTVDKGQGIITTATATYLDGHTGTVNCSSNFNTNAVGTQAVTLTYHGLVGNAKTTGTRTCNVSATVRETNIPSSLSVVPSATTVYNGSEPTYTVNVTYTSGTSKVISSGFTKTGWSSGPGIKTVVFSYSENGKTVTTSINITVKPKITGITVTPTLQTVERYKDPSVTVKAFYEDGSSITVNGYSLSGFDQNVIGVQNVTVQYAEGGITKTAPITIEVTPMKRTCAVCGNEYELDTNDFDQGCPVCKKTVYCIQISPGSLTVNLNSTLPITVTATFLDGHTETVTGWSSNFEPGITGYQHVLVSYLGKYEYVRVIVLSAKHCSICGLEYSLNEDGTDPGCPECSVQLVAIKASPLTQSIKTGETPGFTVVGEYKDGHKEEIAGWTSNYDERILGEQEVTVYYKKLSCKVKVTVISEEQIQCSVCNTVYNLLEYRWGCPACMATIVELEAALKTGGTRTLYGKALDLRVVITYRDRHKEMIFEGWKDNFDPFLIGLQTVTVSYTDSYKNTVSCSLSVEVVDLLTEKICENGHVYYEEDSAGGCPYCAAQTGAEAQDLYPCTYTDEILDKLYTNGIYHFAVGDCISIKVTRKIKGSIYSFKIIGKREETKTLCHGGEVN